MEEIDTDNIIADGRRTRGKEIDFAKAAQEAGDDDEDDLNGQLAICLKLPTYPRSECARK